MTALINHVNPFSRAAASTFICPENHVTQANPNDPVLAQLRAMEILIQQKDFLQAATDLTAFLAAYPTDARGMLLDGILARARGDAEHELAALQRTVAAAPQWAVAHIELARALIRTGDLKAAVESADRAVAVDQQSSNMREAAAAVAATTGNAGAQERHLRTAHALWPDNQRIARNLGIFLIGQRRLAEAETHWRRLHERDPEDVLALGNLGACLSGLGRKAEAIDYLQRALTHDPGNVQTSFQLAIARGETPSTQPREMVRGLFDGYATHFDPHLVGGLKYHVPQRVAAMIHELRPGGFDLLDLGCGTGLTGVYLGKASGEMVGIDLSPGMLAQAAKHNIYTELHEADLLDWLRQVPPETFDIVTANDVFIYVGDVSAVIPACHAVLRPGGLLIFSCETAEESEGELVLRPTRRYAHAKRAINRLCEQAGFGACRFENLDLRMEGNKPIVGYIAIAEKPVQT